MAATTGIEWADSTFNAWLGCTKVSPACDNCYAEEFAKRFHRAWGPTGPRVMTGLPYWNGPETWHRSDANRERPTPRIVFVNSQSDFFDQWPGQVTNSKGGPLWIHPDEPLAFPSNSETLRKGSVPFTLDYARARMLMEIAATPNTIYLLLTKRPQLATAMLHAAQTLISRVAGERVPDEFGTDLEAYLPNVWLGVTVESPKYLGRIQEAKAVGARLTFISHEPAMQSLDFARIGTDGVPLMHGVGWIITGGESGTGARRMDPAVPRYMRDQCKELDIPYFFKQWGDWNEEGQHVGKKLAGATIDGEYHYNWPALAGDRKEAA